MVMTMSHETMMRCFTWLQASLIGQIPSDQESMLLLLHQLIFPIQPATKSTLA